MANRRKRLSLAASTPIHSPGGSEETDRDSPMVIAQDEVKTNYYLYEIFEKNFFTSTGTEINYLILHS